MDLLRDPILRVHIILHIGLIREASMQYSFGQSKYLKLVEITRMVVSSSSQCGKEEPTLAEI